MHFSSSIFIIIIILSACNVVEKEENATLKKARDPQQRLASWWQKVKEQTPQIKNGDLITRTGADVVSNTLCNFNKRDKTYSHSGLAFVENGEVYVYHTYAGKENPGDKMIREKFDSFCNPYRKNGMGIFRYNLSTKESDSLHVVMKNFYKKKIQFDNRFDLKDDSKMYCAEIIFKALKQSTESRVLLPTTTLLNFKFKNAAYKHKTFKRVEYVSIDNLYMNEYCKEIARVKFD
jgi:hypothetical protein